MADRVLTSENKRFCYYTRSTRRKNSFLSSPSPRSPSPRFHAVLSPFETRRASETNTRVVVVVSKVRNDKLRPLTRPDAEASVVTIRTLRAVARKASLYVNQALSSFFAGYPGPGDPVHLRFSLSLFLFSSRPKSASRYTRERASHASHRAYLNSERRTERGLRTLYSLRPV